MHNPSAPVQSATVALADALGHAAPKLWARACARQAGVVERHAEFKRSVAWLAEQRGFQVQTNSPADYYTEQGVVHGRLDFLVSLSGQPALAIEVDFRANPTSAWKLLTKKREGLAVLLLAGFGTSFREVRQRVDGWFKKPTHPWLQLGLLEIHHISPELNDDSRTKPGRAGTIRRSR